MGLFYRTMIREIQNEFTLSGLEDLEKFLKDNEEKFKEEYKMDGLLYYLNINQLLKEKNVESAYFLEKLKAEGNFGFIEGFIK